MQREELQKELRESRQELENLLDQVSEEQMTEPGVMGDWSLKDILAHINRWEGELVTLLFELKQGKKPSRTRIEGQEDVDRLNAMWLAEDRDRELDLVLNDFRGLRKQTLRRLEEFSEDELNDPDRFEALRGEPLWRWVAVDTFEHEREHTTMIREWVAGLN